MKSIKKIKPFSLEDFEKGLMLAGYVSPTTISEVNERNELEEYEKKLDLEKSKNFFKRTVLAAEIAFQLHNEPTFGRVKFQKLVYLCEHIAKMGLNGQYSKQVAGPFDNKFMHTIDTQFKKQKWFEAEKIIQNGITRYKYKALESSNNYKKYYDNYFNDSKTEIEYVINLFRKEKTDLAEISATLYGCLIDLQEKNILINNESLLIAFYNWSDEKKKFNEEQVKSTWVWMKEKSIVP